MGWTSYHATHYKKGQIDRKAECDAYFEEGLNAGHFKVVKSAMHGSVYYGAIKALLRRDGVDENGKDRYVPIPEAEQKVFAVVFLTSVDTKDYYNFAYKDMGETMHPFYYDCPKSLLDVLSDTDDTDALAWRSKCREKLEKKKDGNSLSNLPVGSVIRFSRGSRKIEVIKHRAAYQFKRPFWYDAERNCYVSAKHIPSDYEVVSVGSGC